MSSASSYVLSQDQITKLNTTMNEFSVSMLSYDTAWDESNSRIWIEYLVSKLINELTMTVERNSFITTSPVTALDTAQLEDWKAVIESCIKKKDWIDLISRLAISKMPSHHNLSLPSVEPAVQPEEAATRSQKMPNAWNIEYIGNCHHLLLDYIKSASKVGDSESNSVTILQSSGTGKSRMVHELSDLVFTIPFKLHESTSYDSEEGHEEMAYPPPDVQIRNYLTAPNQFDDCRVEYLCLLGCIFKAVSLELEKVSKSPTYKELAKNWRMHLGSGNNRARIYADAVSASKANQEKLSSVFKRTKKRLKKLISRIDDLCEEAPKYYQIKLILYLDEPRALAEKKVKCDANDKNQFDILCWCFDAFLLSPVFIIYLSTSAKMNRSQVSQDRPLSISARARDAGPKQPPPATETPFDCSPMFPLDPGTLELADVCEVDFMAQFGRPLFWATLKGSRSSNYPLLVNLARRMLLDRFDFCVSVRSCPPAASLAVLDVLLNLDFEPRSVEAREIQDEMIASHMRVVFSSPPDRAYSRSGYPSEPLLAEAAASQMDFWQETDNEEDVMCELLEFHEDILDQEQRREVVFRHLISEAYRRSIRQENPDSNRINFSQGCKLTTFITELFVKQYADAILESVPDNVISPVPFSTTFKDAIIRFTHFGRAADESGTSTNAMLAAFIRCMAIIGWPAQKSVDILIPVLLTPLAKLTESAMSGVLVQITPRRMHGCMTAYNIDHREVGLFPIGATDSAPDTRPYVALLAEIGVTPPTHPGGLLIPEQPAFISDSSRDTHPRYSILADGCSDGVYRVVLRSRYGYQSLLGERDTPDVYPMRTPAALAATREMKPVWRAGSACYGWINNDLLQRDDVGEGTE